MIKTIISTTP